MTFPRQSQLTNIRTAKIRSFFSMFLVAVPVIVPYWQSLGLTIQQALNLQAIFALSVALFEIPTGYIADLFGRKASLIAGSFIAACGMTYLPFAKSYESLIIFEISVALGGALCSGSDLAILYDSLDSGENNSKIIGSISHYSLLGEAMASVLGGILVIHSFSAVIWAQAAAMWIPFLASFVFIEPPIERMQSGKHLNNIGKVLRHIFSENKMTRLIFINCIVWGLSSFCVVWLLQPYWEDQNINLSLFGILWAILMLVSAYSSKYGHWIEDRIGTKKILILISYCGCAGYFLMASGVMTAGLTAAVLFYVTRGLTSSILVDLFNSHIKSAYRATANSFSSLAFRLGFAVIGPVIGISVNNLGLLPSLFLLGLFFMALFFIVMLPLIINQKQRVKSFSDINSVS